MERVTVDTADSLDLIASMEYDAIVTDIKMPGTDGLTLLGEIRTQWPGTPTPSDHWARRPRAGD